MSVFTNKGVFKKLLCIIIVITIFSAVIPSNVSYASESDLIADVGGVLLSPIASLLIGVGDIFMNIMHDALYDLDSSLMLVSKKSDGWGIFWTVVAAIGAVIAAVVLIWLGGLAGAALLAKFGITLGAAASASLVGTAIVFTLSSGLAAGTFTALAWFGDNVVFPMYQVSPEEIFRGEIPLLDVNFFKEYEEENVESPEYFYTLPGISVDIGPINNLEEWTLLNHVGWRYQYTYDENPDEEPTFVQIAELDEEFMEKHGDQYEGGSEWGRRLL